MPQIDIHIVGGGGRETAILIHADKSPLVDERRRIVLPSDDRERKMKMKHMVRDMIKEKRKGAELLVVFGREAELVEGMANEFRSHGILALGPSKAAAMLEGDKWWAKEKMLSLGVPTAKATLWTGNYSPSKLADELSGHPWKERPLVVKARYLKLGMGVAVVKTLEEAVSFINSLGGEDFLLEEFLQGQGRFTLPETTFQMFVDLHGNILPLASAQDYKRRLDGNLGPNTGGMGAVSPDPKLTPDMDGRIVDTIFEPVVREMIKLGTPFSGILCADIILTDRGPVVCEINVRPSDPPIQTLLPRCETDLVPIMYTIAKGGSIKGEKIVWRETSVVCVVIVRDSYPNAGIPPIPIPAWLYDTVQSPGVTVLEAGVQYSNPYGCLHCPSIRMSLGGRVLNIIGEGANPWEARKSAYNHLNEDQRMSLDFDWRRDIAGEF